MLTTSPRSGFGGPVRPSEWPQGTGAGPLGRSVPMTLVPIRLPPTMPATTCHSTACSVTTMGWCQTNDARQSSSKRTGAEQRADQRCAAPPHSPSTSSFVVCISTHGRLTRSHAALHLSVKRVVESAGSRDRIRLAAMPKWASPMPRFHSPGHCAASGRAVATNAPSPQCARAIGLVITTTAPARNLPGSVAAVP
jgi:hypothetical protein